MQLGNLKVREAPAWVAPRSRHVHALRAAQQHLQRADEHARRGASALELLAEELRAAHDALGSITGRLTPDELLGEIFGRFCIGK